MADQVEELIKEIAAKHGIAVSRDDPILVLQTINNRLMQDSSKAQQAQLDQYKEELEALALRWGTDAKDKAERILNAALTASKGAMDKAMQENAKSTAATVRAEVDAALGRVAGQVKDARRQPEPLAVALHIAQRLQRQQDAPGARARQARAAGHFTQGLLGRGGAERADHLQPARKRLHVAVTGFGRAGLRGQGQGGGQGGM